MTKIKSLKITPFHRGFGWYMSERWDFSSERWDFSSERWA